MQDNSQKRGIALGAVLALFASIFVGAAPAQATTPTDGAHIATTPYEGPVGNFNGTILEDFPIMSYLLPGVTNNNFSANKVRYSVTRVSGAVDIYIASTSATAIAADAVRASVSSASGGTAALANGGAMTASSYAAVIHSDWTTASVFTPAALDSSAALLTIRAISESATLASLSAITAVVDVKVWVENTATNNNVHDALEWYTTKRITLHAVSAVPVTGAISQMAAGDKVVTVSATVGALNFENLSGQYYLQMASTANTFKKQGAAGMATTVSANVTADTAASRSGVISTSFDVSASAGVSSLDSISGRVIYSVDSATYEMGSTFSMVVTNPGITEIVALAVAGDNATQSGTTTTVRTNTTTTFKLGAKTNSASVSSKVISVRFTDTDANLAVSVKELKFNGGTATTSFPTSTSPLSLTTGADGFASFTLESLGFVGGETFAFTAYVGNVSKSMTVEVEAATHSVVPVYTTYQSGAGETTAVSWTIKDQWLANNTRTDLRLKVTKGGSGFNYAQTVSYVPVTGGTATFNYTPEPATKTGSAKVNATLQALNVNTGGYIETGKSAAEVTVNVSATANSFGAGLAASRSVSISYFPDTLSWVAVTGKVANTGSAVAVSGAGLIFKDAAGLTYSGAVTVRADGNLGYSFDVAGTLAGTYTITLTNGSATTTSLVIVDPASHSSGAAMSFDITAIQAGKTAIVTGTLVDANGNPVDTTQGDGTASIVVTYAGTAGIPVGSMPTETDADGKFRVSILTSAADSGTFTLTAVYLKNGASTALVDRVTKVHSITVGDAASTPAASDKKVNAGSFKGYVAVYAKGYEGQRLSAKIGNDWVVVESLDSDFERVTDFTGAGYTIAVRIYIDRVLMDTITVTTK